MASQTLADLYKLHPAAQGAVQKSVGYAVFNNLGVNLLLLSTAHGSGLAVNSKSKQETFGAADCRLAHATRVELGAGKENPMPPGIWSGSARNLRPTLQLCKAAGFPVWLI